MPRSVPVVAVLLAACASNPPAAAPAAPDVPVVVTWPAGTRFRAGLATTTADTREHRAAAAWWREALRQSVAHELFDGDDPHAPVLELTIDDAASALAACLVQDGRTRIVAGESFAAGALGAAIDRLAWAARVALGERAAAPIAAAAGTSRVPEVVLAVDDAMLLARDGGFQAAWRILADARTKDGASPFVLDGIAALQLLRGEPLAAERTAREALGYEARLLPTTKHRLARTMLLARASLPGNDAVTFDRELLRLATTTRGERPHDPQPVLSEAIAHNFLGDFAEARPLLVDLLARLPEQPIVAYHLGWACLGGGDAKSAADAFERASAQLPAAALLLPRAIALFEAGEHQRLQELLQDLRAQPGNEGLELDLLRMQAAHALLRADRSACRAGLVAILNWLGTHPLVCAQRGGELAEQGALLVRLGGGDELAPLLTAIQRQHAGSGLADVAAFLSGLATVHRTRERQEALAAQLGQGGDNPWSYLLEAYARELRGEVADMQAALARAAQVSSSPMTKTLLARGLQATGRSEHANKLLTTLRAEMKTLRLRAVCRHPLLGPELAFAFAGDGP